VMRTNVLAFHASDPVSTFSAAFKVNRPPRGQYLFPVLDADQKVEGVITRKDLQKVFAESPAPEATIGSIAHRTPVVAYSNEPLRAVAYRMAEKQFTRMPVVDPEKGYKFVGMISLEDLLGGRVRTLTEERQRERILRMKIPGAVNNTA
jgi:chloride channel protein, CIC family